MKKLMFAAGLALAAGTASAQYTSDFEAPLYNASATGITLNGTPSPTPGQDGWYQPVATLSKDYLCYTYAGNDLGFPQNPNGGAQFAAGRNPGVSDNTRTQRNFAWVDGTKYIVEWDIAFNYNGITPATDNLGSFSLQPSATARFWQTLYRFEAVATPTEVRADYNVYNAANVLQQFQNLNPAWRNLKMNNWYRQRTVFDFTTNSIIEIGIQDITGGGSMVVIPAVDPVFGTWHLFGGATPTTQGMPTDLRFFSGGTTAGNTVAWDNLSVQEDAAACYPDCDGSGTLNIDDFICFQTFYAIGDPYADCDSSGNLNIDDFICFQTFYAIGC